MILIIENYLEQIVITVTDELSHCGAVSTVSSPMALDIEIYTASRGFSCHSIALVLIIFIKTRF